jgi:hypothetical protein
MTALKYKVGDIVMLSRAGRIRWCGEQPDGTHSRPIYLDSPMRNEDSNPAWLSGEIIAIHVMTYQVKWKNGIKNAGYSQEHLIGDKDIQTEFKLGDEVMLSQWGLDELSHSPSNPHGTKGEVIEVCNEKAQQFKGYSVKWETGSTNGNYGDRYLVAWPKEPVDDSLADSKGWPKTAAEFEREEAVGVLRELAGLMGYDLVKKVGAS